MSRATPSASARTAHSQASTTVHPAASSCARFRPSRSRFRENFRSQNALFALGSAGWHVGQRCQKQPWTKTATRRPG